MQKMGQATNFSSPFTVTNGVRQGVICPYLFAVYLDELSEQLGSARWDALWEIWL